jgi:hypothetical protein
MATRLAAGRGTAACIATAALSASMSELARGSAVDALTEVTLGAAQVVARVLPVRSLTRVGRGGPRASRASVMAWSKR